MRDRMRALRIGVVAGVIATVPWGAVAQAGGADRADGIHGTIRIFGCDVSAADLMVRARPIHAARGSDDGGRDAAGGPTRVMHAVPGATPGAFTFSFRGFAANTPYRVGVKLFGPSAHRCPQIAWTAERDPLVLGGDPPLAFRGYAVRSKLEVLATADGRATTRRSSGDHWVGADTLDFDDPTKAVRQFRWQSGLPGVTGGQLQISLTPFPRIQQRAYDPCASDTSGVILRADFAAVGGAWTMLPAVDLGALILGSRASSGRLDEPRGVDPRTLAKLDLGMPLYVRVVPRIAGELVCDPDRGGTPPEVLLARLLLSLFAPPPSPDATLKLGNIWYSKPVIGKHPTPSETCYRVTKKHAVATRQSTTSVNVFPGVWEFNAYYHASKSDPWPSPGLIYVLPGAMFCVNDSGGDDGWFDSVVDTFGSVLSGVVDGLGKLVNFTSSLWEEIQDAVVDTVANVVDDVGIVDCAPDSPCRGALETGLEVAMASMGVPPSLPNFTQVMDQGFDYVAAQIASEVGVPSVLSDYASDKAQEFAKKAAKDLQASYGVPGLPDWLVPDLRFDPAFLVMEVFGRGLDNPYLSRPVVFRLNTPIYAGAHVFLPQRLPMTGEKPLLFPMVLPPNLDGLPSAPSGYDEYQKARVDKNYWTNMRYTNGCYHLVLSGGSDPGGFTLLTDLAFRTNDSSIACAP